MHLSKRIRAALRAKGVEPDPTPPEVPLMQEVYPHLEPTTRLHFARPKRRKTTVATLLVLALVAPFLLCALVLVIARVVKWWNDRALDAELQRVEDSQVPDHSSTPHYAVAVWVCAAHGGGSGNVTTEDIWVFSMFMCFLAALAIGCYVFQDRRR